MSYHADPIGNPRPFTLGAWLLWTAMPAAAISPVSWLGEYALEQVGNGGPGGAMGTAVFLLVLWFALVSIIATMQWLILRRTWHVRWLWPAWLFANLLCLIVFCVFLVKNHPTVTIFTIGFLPASVLSLAGPKRLRFPAFVALFISFLSGAALAWAIPYYVMPLSLLARHNLPDELSGVFMKHYLELSFVVGAAVSGIGISLVSQWASPNRVAPDAGDSREPTGRDV